jgi:hypothetical protein
MNHEVSSLHISFCLNSITKITPFISLTLSYVRFHLSVHFLLYLSICFSLLPFYLSFLGARGVLVVKTLRYKRQVAGSIPDSVI